MNLLLSTGAWIGIGASIFVVIAVIIWAICTRNGFIRFGTQNENALHDIDIYLKKRYDLIPNLVETVKGYAKHEKETFEQIVAARNNAQNAVSPEEKVIADAELTKTIRNFNVVMENYPELKANTNFLDLQGQLKSIESELANARKYYNATVAQYNTKIRLFPALIIANCMKLKSLPYCKIENEEERKNIKVQF